MQASTIRLGITSAAALLIACNGEAGTDTEGTPGVRPEITAAALRSGTYASQYVEEGSVVLVNGEFRDTARRVTVVLQPEYASGDLDGDGSPDAATVLSTNTGGTGTFQDLVVVRNDGGPVAASASRFLGDRVPVDRVRIVDGEIQLELTMHGPADPMCCPTLEVTRRFRLEGSELVEIEPPPGAPDYTP